MSTMFTEQKIRKILHCALQSLWKEKPSLFVDSEEGERTIHERAVVARLFYYLLLETKKLQGEQSGPTWDFEYNRQTNGGSSMNSKEIPKGNSKKKIFPDLILHERNTKENYCVIEVKCYPSYSFREKYIKKDYETLIGLLNDHNYNFAISLIISNEEAHLTWFTKGPPKDSQLSIIFTEDTIIGKRLKKLFQTHLEESQLSSPENTTFEECFKEHLKEHLPNYQNNNICITYSELRR